MAHHGSITASEDIHLAYAWTYADAAARTGATGFVSTDVGKLARQLDDNSLWMLTAVTPTWVSAATVDAASVAAAGAVMEADTTTAAMSFVVDEDNMGSDLATKVPTQQSVKAYVDSAVAGGGYTDEMAQDAVGAMIATTSSVALTYTDATPELKAEIVDAYVQALIDATNPMTDKGDLLTRSASNLVRQPVGSTDGKILTVDSATSTGLRWAAPDEPIPNVATGVALGNVFQTRSQRGVKKTPGVTTHTVHGYGTGSFAGTSSNADDDTGLWLNLATSDTLNNVAGHAPAANTELRRAYNPDTTYVVKTAANVSDIGLWIGSSSTNLGAAPTPNYTYAVFRYYTTVDGTAFWRCATDNGSGTPEETTTSVAVAVDTVYVLRIVMSATNVKFYIDGTLVATHSTTIPAASTMMGHNAGRVVNLVGGAGTAKSIKFSRFDCLHGP